MANVNTVFLLGRATRDFELRYTPTGKAVTTVPLVINHKFGEGKEEVLFIEVNVWGKMAENCAKYLTKGSEIFVQGRLKMQTWRDKETGNDRSKTIVEAERIQFIKDVKPKDSAPPAHNDEDVPF